MADKILVICAPDTFALGCILKTINDPHFSFEVPDLSQKKDDTELYFMKLCMNLSRYDKIIVLLSDQIFFMQYLDLVLNAMADLNMGIFIAIGEVTNYPNWFPQERVVQSPAVALNPKLELWEQLFSRLKTNK